MGSSGLPTAAVGGWSLDRTPLPAGVCAMLRPRAVSRPLPATGLDERGAVGDGISPDELELVLARDCNMSLSSRAPLPAPTGGAGDGLGPEGLDTDVLVPDGSARPLAGRDSSDGEVASPELSPEPPVPGRLVCF